MIPLFLTIVAIAAYFYWRHEKARKSQGGVRGQAHEKRSSARNERRRVELKHLRRLPTSWFGFILGRRIVRQIKTVTVDVQPSRRDAELEFLRLVETAGGTAAINMRIRRHLGNYASIQGDAVLLAS